MVDGGISRCGVGDGGGVCLEEQIKLIANCR